MWQVKLTGEERDLKAFVINASQLPIKITKEAEGYLLTASEFESIQKPEEIQEIAQEIIGFINTALVINNNLPTKVKADSYFKINENGKKEYEFNWIGSVEATLETIVYDGKKLVPDYWYRLWNCDIRVREAFNLYMRPDHDWFSLYKVFETIIYDDELNMTGTKPKEIVSKMGWASEEEGLRFYESANWHRHAPLGKSFGKPNDAPSIQMSKSQAIGFVRKIMSCWLAWKQQNQNPAAPK